MCIIVQYHFVLCSFFVYFWNANWRQWNFISSLFTNIVVSNVRSPIFLSLTFYCGKYYSITNLLWLFTRLIKCYFEISLACGLFEISLWRSLPWVRLCILCTFIKDMTRGAVVVLATAPVCAGLGGCVARLVYKCQWRWHRKPGLVWRLILFIIVFTKGRLYKRVNWHRWYGHVECPVVFCSFGSHCCIFG